MKKPVVYLFLFCAFLLSPGNGGAQNPVNEKWREFSTEHFIIYYPVGQEFTANQAAIVAEKVQEPLVRMYGPVDSKIHIVIRDDEDYSNGGAYYYDNKVEIYATSLDYEFRSYSDWLWNVVTHELTHVYSMHDTMKATRRIPMIYYQQVGYQEEKREDVLVGYPNVLVSYSLPMFTVPSWLAEGVAQFQTRSAHFDSLDSHREMMLRQAALHNKLLGIDQIASFNWDGRENEMVYNHGYSLVTFIARKYGEDKIMAIMKALSSPSVVTFDGACRKVLQISQGELYKEWSGELRTRYTAVRDSLGTIMEGKPFRKGGFINGSPAWSPDGSKLAYVSNYGQDYGITSCLVANLKPGGWKWKNKDSQEEKAKARLEKKLKELKTPEEKEDAFAESGFEFDISLAGGIQSSPVWLDEWNILFNRRSTSNRYGSHWWDIYRYVINTKDPHKGTKKRITTGLRGTSPDLSPDHGRLVFVKNSAGIQNLFIMERKDNSLRQITFFTDGTQVYRPKWSPDGSSIAFTIHQQNHVDIACINSDGSGFRYLVASPGQDRDPSWTSDGRSIIFSSDVSGIANLYRLNIFDGAISRLTNVIGGAFSPVVSPGDTTLAFSYYGKDGYEIRLMPLNSGINIADFGIFHEKDHPLPGAPKSAVSTDSSEPYRMKTLGLSLMPRFVNDRGNFKLGTYILKNEVVDQGNFMFGGDISPSNRDTDLFALFEYKKFIPTVFVEMYRQTRNVLTNENYMEEYGTIIQKRKFDLNEIDFGLRYKYNDRHNFEGRLIYSQYNATLEYTNFLTGPLVLKPSYTYSKGFDMAFMYSQDNYIRARDETINPRGGRKIQVRYDRFTNFFLDDFEYVGFLREKYKRYPYNQIFANWEERLPVPSTERHTLNLRGQVNLIDRQVDPFYELQLGGPAQMRGYTFYSLSGRKTAMGQILYRFPLLYDMKKKYFTWYFNHVYMGVFADVGRAWDERDLNWSAKGFKRDAGMELRLDAISFYNLPTMIEFSTAYGPDPTWVKMFDPQTSSISLVKDTQNPWKFYFSVLFGFN
jgi:Tol biopolymer transport system component